MTPAPQCLSAEETYKILDWLATERILLPNVHRCSRDSCMVLLMLDAGLRVGELQKLDVYDLWQFDMPVDSLLIRAEISKSKRDRTVPLTPRIHNSLIQMDAICWTGEEVNFGCPAFTTGHRDNRMSIRQIQRVIKDIGSLAIKRRLTPHMLRHTFATRLMRSTNIRIVQSLLGHTSLSSTQVYTHPDADDLKKAISGLV